MKYSFYVCDTGMNPVELNHLKYFYYTVLEGGVGPDGVPQSPALQKSLPFDGADVVADEDLPSIAGNPDKLADNAG